MPIAQLALDGHSLRVRTAGEHGPSVVFAVDPPNVLEHYARLFVALKPHVRITAFEPPGFGQSRAPRTYDHSFEQAAAVTIRLLERLPAGPHILAFTCLSAYVALRVAKERPDLVAGLVLIQAPAWDAERAWLDRIDVKRLLRTPLVGPTVMALKTDDITRKWYAAAVPDEAERDWFTKLSIETMDHGARFPLAAALRAAEHEAAPVAVAQPTMLVWGGADRSHRIADAGSLRALLPQAESVTFDASGHFPELHEPTRFRDVLLAWMMTNQLA